MPFNAAIDKLPAGVLPLPASSNPVDRALAGQVQGTEGRDIFSLDANLNASGNVENTPRGQLPDHLKIVGVLIGKPSEIIIEDSLSKQTYFIDEKNSQEGIQLKKAGQDKVTIIYQGQEIEVPVVKG